MAYGDSNDYLDYYPLHLATHTFGSGKKAKKVVRQLRQGIRACLGTTRQSDGVRVKITTFDAAASRLPENTLAYEVRGGYDEGTYVITRKAKTLYTAKLNARLSSREMRQSIAHMAVDQIVP